MRLFGNTQREQVLNISTQNISANPYQPRKHFDEAKLQELADSIVEMGIIQPITVRKRNNSYEIVAGERRFRAAKRAGLKEIPALVKDYSDTDMARAALIENIQRENLNPLEEAQAYDHLLQQFNITQDDLAKQVGKSQSTIANKRRLLKLTPEVKQYLYSGELTERHARALLRIKDENQQIDIANLAVNSNWTVREINNYIDDFLKKSLEQGHDLEKKKKKRRFVVRDIRIFTNAINAAYKTMRESGIDAKLSKNETEQYQEYIIRIPK